MIYILKKCCMTVHAACWMQFLDCIAQIQTYTIIYVNMSELTCEFHPATHETMKQNYEWNYEMKSWNAVLNDNLMWDRWQLWEQSRNLVKKNVIWALISENWADSSVSQLISSISWFVHSYTSTLVDESLYK